MSLEVSHQPKNKSADTSSTKASPAQPLATKDAAARFKSLLITKRMPAKITSNNKLAFTTPSNQKPVKAKMLSEPHNKKLHGDLPKDPCQQDATHVVGLSPCDARFIEQNIGAIAQITAATKTEEEINKLIKQLASSFRAKKSESHFTVASGIFAGAHFNLAANGSNLVVRVNDASTQAQALLRDHQSVLEDRLRFHEIKLTDLVFPL